MSEPIRSAPSSPFAFARPQVQSRRVSFRLGPFGLTYSTDRVLWNAEGGASPSSPAASADPPPLDPPPVDPAPGLGARPAPGAAPGRPYTSPSPADLEAALRQARLWQAAQRQAAQERAADQGAAQAADCAASANTVRAGQAYAGQARHGQASGAGPLRNALRQASQAYLACAANFASPPPMLQAVA